MNTDNEMPEMQKEALRNAGLKKEIGLRLKEFRNSIKKSQAQLAKELKVCHSTITGIETGKFFPGIALQNYLYHQYQLNLNWLLIGKGDMIISPAKDSKYSELPLLFWHLSENDPRFEKYVELISMMRMPIIEHIILGKLAEVKIIAEKEIKSFFEAT